MLSGGEPVPARLSSSLLLVRDNDAGALEVVTLQRHRESGFAAGAIVFPGGKVEAEDEEVAHTTFAHHQDQFERTEISLRLAALRESWEEAGISYFSKDVCLSDPEAKADVFWKSTGLQETSEHPQAGLPDLTQLLSFAHWITPRGLRRRFDTHFFLGVVPGDQTLKPDGREAVTARWSRPQTVLEAWDVGKAELMLPTRMILTRLARYKSVEEAAQSARTTPVITVQPEPLDKDRVPYLVLPEEAGYGVTEIPLDEVGLKAERALQARQ